MVYAALWDKENKQQCRRDYTDDDADCSEEQSSWTDVETRCAFGVGSSSAAAAAAAHDSDV